MSCSFDSLELKSESEDKNIYIFEIRVKRVYLNDSVLMAKLKALNANERGKVSKQKEDGEELDEESGEFSVGETEEEEMETEEEELADLEAVEAEEVPEEPTEDSDAPKNIVDKKLKDYIDNTENFDIFRKEGTVDLLQKGQFDQLTSTYGVINITEEFESDSDLEKSDKTESSLSLDYLKFVEENFDDLGSKLKVVIPLYEANGDVEIRQEHFVDNVNELIFNLMKQGSIKIDDQATEKSSRKQKMKDMTNDDILLFCEDLTTRDAAVFDPQKQPDEPVDIEELREMSLRREIVVTTPFSLVSQIVAGPLLISIVIERIMSPMILIGTSKMRFGQEFIDAIVTAATSIQKTSVVRRVKLPIRNNFEEQVGILYLFLKITCLGSYIPKLEPMQVDEELPSNSEFERNFTGEYSS